MDRQITTKKDLTLLKPIGRRNFKGIPNKQLKEDGENYYSRLLKYIPAEIIGLYITLINIINAQSTIENWVSWTVFFICLIFTPLYLRRVLDVSKITQLLISSLSFVVWAYAIGGPLDTIGLHNEVFAAILLPSFTVLVGIIEPQYIKR